jgi:hypothetical protein
VSRTNAKAIEIGGVAKSMPVPCCKSLLPVLTYIQWQLVDVFYLVAIYKRRRTDSIVPIENQHFAIDMFAASCGWHGQGKERVKLTKGMGET